MAKYDIETARKNFSNPKEGLGLGTFLGKFNSQDTARSIPASSVGGRLSPASVERGNEFIRNNAVSTTSFNAGNTNTEISPTVPVPAPIPDNIPAPVQSTNPVTVPEVRQEVKPTSPINGLQTQQVAPKGLASGNIPLHGRQTQQPAAGPTFNPQRKKRNFAEKFLGINNEDSSFKGQGLNLSLNAL